MTESSLDRLASELRTLRACFGGYRGEVPNSPGGWSAAIYTYDTALVRAANLLGVSGAPDPDYVIGRRRLTDFERAQIEEGLADAGVEVRPARALGDGRDRLLGLPSGRSSSASNRAGGPLGLPVAPPTGARRPARPAGGRRQGDNGDAAPLEQPDRARPSRQPGTRRRVGQLAEDARRLRQRLDEYRRSGQTWPTKVAEWSADLDTYDETILALADMLELPLPIPPGARRRLLAEDRVRLEQDLAEAGVELREATRKAARGG